MRLSPLRLVSIIVVLTLVVSLPVRAQDVARMEQIVEARTAGATPFMGVVLVARGDRIVFDEAYGFADLEWQVPASPPTKFRLGSLTKQFTAAAVLLLEERGHLRISDPVRQHLPGLPETWAAITVEHLLAHTAGLPNYTALPDYRTWSISPATPEELVSRFRDLPLDFVPGTDFRYSNSGYVVLGLLIEKLSGRTYAEFIEQSLLQPLGMKDTGYDTHSAVMARRASGYAPGAGGLINAPYLDMSVPYAAGALYSTSHDLLAWQRALYGGTLLSAASLRKMTTPVRSDYGFGVTIPAGAPRRVFRHGGGINGFATALAYYPETRTTVAVLSNVVAAPVSAIAADLGAVAHGEVVQLASERTEITVSPDILREYVGTYQLGQAGTMYIRLSDGKLTGQIVGQPQLPLFAESQTRFFLKVVDAQIDFARDAAGAVTHLVLHQNGNSITWQRTSSDTPPVPAPRTAVSVPADVLARYPGVYELRPGFDLTITVVDGALRGQATGQGAFPLSAASPTTFFFEPGGITIEFVSDPDGTVTHMRFEQGGGTVEARRK